MRKYKWGTNKFYKEAAIKKFTQLMFSRCSLIKGIKKDYINILKSLAAEDARKFNQHKLFISSNIYDVKKKGKWSPSNYLVGKNFLILGPGENAKKNKSKLIKLIHSKTFCSSIKFVKLYS